MAALAFTALEGIALRVLAAVGVGVVGGAAGESVKEQARKRQEEADKAKSSPMARTDATTQTKEKCKECPPDSGKPFQRNFKVRKPWIDYQAKITGMANGPTFIMEWDFAGTKFDGFVSAGCLLQDAKGGYDKFFNLWGGFDCPFQREIFREMSEDAAVQNNKAAPKPPVRLRWYFQEPVSFRYMQRILLAAAPQIEVEYQP
jgi:Restriction endonuclease fold toxin 5